MNLNIYISIHRFIRSLVEVQSERLSSCSLIYILSLPLLSHFQINDGDVGSKGGALEVLHLCVSFKIKAVCFLAGHPLIRKSKV